MESNQFDQFRSGGNHLALCWLQMSYWSLPKVQVSNMMGCNENVSKLLSKSGNVFRNQTMTDSTDQLARGETCLWKFSWRYRYMFLCGKGYARSLPDP